MGSWLVNDEQKEATSRFVHLEKFSLSSSFAIRVNLLHP